MIWDSAIDCGKKGWRVAVIYYTRKSISDYYKWLQNTCGPAIKHCIKDVKTFPTWKCNIFLLKKYLDSLTPSGVLYSDIRKGSQYYYYHTFNCHLNQLSYFSPIIDSLSIIIIEFQLDYIEAVSIL